MTYMQIIVTAIAALGACYFVVKKRQFDYFALAFFSALVYFIPGFVGATSYSVDGQWSDTPIHPEVYGVMIFVLVSILLAEQAASRVTNAVTFNAVSPGVNFLPGLFAIAASAGFAGLLLTSGSEVFQWRNRSYWKA